MTPYILRCSKSTALIFLRLKQYNVDFWYEQKHEYNSGTKAGAQTQRQHFKVRTEIQRYESDPDDTRGVHTKADEFRLVEILGQIASAYGVHGTQTDQKHVIAERANDRQATIVALQACIIPLWVVDIKCARLKYKHGYYQAAFHRDDDACDNYLRSETHESRLVSDDFLLASRQYTSNSVGFGEQSAVHKR